MVAHSPLRYTGKQLDPDTGLYYSRARWYSPYLGRFMSRDPIGIDDGLHMYAYVGNDPINYTDPSGECALAGAAIGGSIELGLQLFNRKDRAAWGKAWDRFSGGDFRGAYQASHSQIGRVGEGALVGGVTCGVGGAAYKGFKSYKSFKSANTGVPNSSIGLADEIGILRDAARGKGNFTIRGAVSEQDAIRLGEAWVGPGFKIASDGKTLVSANGLKQFRPRSFKPRLGKDQVNFERRFEPSGQWQGNGHLDVIP